MDNGTVFDGDLAIELYSEGEQVNTFEQIVKADLSGNSGETLGTNAFNAINSLSKPKLREVDYGVVSAFNLPDETDLLGNNKITVTNSAISGNFAYSDYAYSFGFTCSFTQTYTNETIATLNIGSETIVIYAGGTMAANVNGTVNALPSFSYVNKTVKFVVVADAYFLSVYVDGQKFGFLNKNKKATQFNFVLNKLNGKSFGNIAFWNRDISFERVTQWNLDQNPFNLKGIKDKLFPAKGYQISNHLLEGNPYFKIPAEQTIKYFKGKYFLYYTVARSTPSVFIESGIAVAISGRPDGGFKQYTNDAIIGGLRNKAGVTRAMGSCFVEKDGFMYCFAAMDYTAPSAGGKIFKSTDGYSDFTYVGDFIPGGSIPELANISIFPDKKGNYYYGIVEGKVNGVWISYLVRSLSFESGWEMVQVLNSLEITSGVMYGGPELLRSSNDDRWMCFYHAAHEAPQPGDDVTKVAPTSLFYAECFDTGAPINWVNKKKVLDINDELAFYNAFNCDQVATPQIYEEKGKTYLSYVLAQNIRPGAPADEEQLFCQIRVAQFDGTKEELVGIVPFEYDTNPVLNLGNKFNLSNVTERVLQYPDTFTKIVASGTSITNGVGSDGGSGITEANTWRAKIQATLTSFTGRTITVVNGGVSGQNTTGMKNNLPALLSGVTGQVVILEGAINDAQTAGVGLPVSTTISNLSSMIEMVINSGNYPVLSTPMPLDFSITAVSNAYTVQKRDNLVLAVHMLAKRYKTRLIDFDKAAENNVSFLVDGIHPNINGYAFMADIITPELV
ncbi:GDSL-type esterase/lipase family protein [Chryseobacterium sp. Alg-005]|uniref:GDSL-type esterase/lipase family protein n=1 Tax=Chryseobacterium sp. Alg-005 TaxID=3159516 RepID=UPI0036F40CB0